jgi:hypothetical protein
VRADRIERERKGRREGGGSSFFRKKMKNGENASYYHFSK